MQKSKERVESAMEYLMTYGWAILIIAMILGVLYYLGAFNSVNDVPKEPPGSCSVFRPDGPGTTTNINFEGECEIDFPQFILISRGPGDFVNVPGSNSMSSSLNIQSNNITITAWVFVIGSPYHDIVDKENQYGMKIDVANSPHQCTPSNNIGFCLEWDTTGNWIGQSFPIPGASYNKWMFLAVSMSGQNKYWYADGQLIGNAVVSGQLSYQNSNLTIAAISPGYTGYGEAEWFNGELSNVQLYNTALSPGDIDALYNEGIGGPPINLANLVGWWPLNGNGYDYSGDINDGYVQNQSSIDTWDSSYPTP